ncbi:MAG: hypothetical protein AMQ74_01872 [Candidatus Methanofastidiosum methylothiophilum]|uniref:Uncharacterized protein n=1 Tax=Candidatus Methanofastidiosum methylothiophilum TaxID=1705564 RepID=A0A150IM48_9EURY|nr:MAG: hypothetical protein AMQ74_01872 [Candidatus Methanofastidiosum methylthiophilus]
MGRDKSATEKINKELQESLDSVRGIKKPLLQLEVTESDLFSQDSNWADYYAILTCFELGHKYQSGTLWTEKEVLNELEKLKDEYDLSEVEQDIKNGALVVLGID